MEAMPKVQNLVGGPISDVIDLISCEDDASLDNMLLSELTRQEEDLVSYRLLSIVANFLVFTLISTPFVEKLSSVPLVGGILRETETSVLASAGIALAAALIL